MKGAFEVKQKAFFIIFKELSVAKICLRPESMSLILQSLQKDHHSIDFLEISNPRGSGTKKGYKRVRSKNTFEKGAKKKNSSTKRSIATGLEPRTT